ncbi:MAG: hypothetical protein KGI54_10530 [Pseudomonadota bacterium]|nr:hypothetical protein [Pseudomonadota bacterium]
MTDKELLELAAKAAGYSIHSDAWARIYSDEGKTLFMGNHGPAWNPLTDDGDALRLEVALKATAVWEPMRGEWSVGAIVNGEFKWLAFHEIRNRAATKAAAEIGKAMP